MALVNLIQGKQIATASWAINAISSSYALSSSFASNSLSSSFATSSSFAISSSYSVSSSQSQNAQTASYALQAVSSSFAISASQAGNSISSSYSISSSFAANATTASFVTGSNVFGPFGSNSVVSSSFAVSSSRAISSSFASTASFAPNYLPLTGGTVNGSLTINNNLTVLGSASIQYISESTLNIGTNLITVNTFTPSVRFGGLAVIDSGSSPQVSASFLYDSLQDEFIFVHRGTAAGAITSSHFLLGPETYNNLGNETYLTANRIPKGTGIEHLNDSNISDNGSVVSINSNTQVTGSLIVTQGITGSLFGTSSFAQTASFLASTTNAFIQGGNSFGAQALIGTNDNQNLALETSGSTRMFISSSGLIGIGTTAPENILSISATLPVDIQEDIFSIKNLNVTRTVINNRGGQAWFLNNGSSEVGRIAYTTPSNRPGIVFLNSTSTGRSDIRQITGGGISIATTTLGTIPSDQFYFYPTGNFSINTTDSGFRLDVNGTARVSGTTTITPPALTGTSATNALDIAQTWNTTGTPTAIGLNVTDTASNTASKLLDIQLGGNSLVSTFKTITRFNQSIYVGGASTSDTSTAFFATLGGNTFSGGGNSREFYTNKTLTTTGTSTLSWSGFEFNTAINQSTGSTGITRGLYINPNITNAIDFRAIETTQGRNIFTDTTIASGSANSGSLLDLSQTWNTTGTPTLIRANVTDTASPANTPLLMDLRVGNVSRFTINKNGRITFGAFGATQSIFAENNGITFTNLASNNQSGFIFSNGQGTIVSTFGTTNGIRVTAAGQVSGFAPSSGTAVYNSLFINEIINQTGGANGITRGLFVNPTLTSAFDFRAIENTVGNVTLNTTSGNTSIGKTNPNAKLDVNGNTIITGSLAVSQSLLQYSNITAVTSGSTSNVASFNTSSYTAAFFDYVTTSGTNARAGSVFTVWNGNNVEYAETSTNDIGNTNNLLLSASVSAGAIRLQATSLSGSWSVKTLARMI